MSIEYKKEPWHLSKSVPIAPIFTIIFQTCVLVWWASDLSATVNQHTSQIEQIHRVEEVRTRDERTLYSLLASISTKMEQVAKSQERLERKFEQSIQQ